MLHPLPEDVSLELGALVEPMAVGYHAATLGGIAPGDTAVVFGAGPIGIALWFALRALRVEDVIVVEPAVARRSAIAALGAAVLDPDDVDVVEAVMARTHGRGADAAWDAAGVAATVSAAVNCLAPDAPLVAVALYGAPVATDLTRLLVSESRIRGSLAYTADDFDAVIGLMARGHYDTTGWVEHIALDDLVEVGIPELRAGRRIKVLVDAPETS